MENPEVTTKFGFEFETSETKEEGVENKKHKSEYFKDGEREKQTRKEVREMWGEVRHGTLVGR